jgi:hypothetical protein
LYLWMGKWFQNWFLFQRFMGFERQAAQNNPFMFSEFLFSRKVFFPINFGLCLISGFMRPIRTKYHRSIQR